MPLDRSTLLLACFVLGGCYSRDECNPQLLGVTDGEARLFNIEAVPPGYAVSLNRADWVVSRLNDVEKQARDVSYFVAGKAAAAVFAFSSSPRCDPSWFLAQVDGVKAKTTLRNNELRMDTCGVAGCTDPVTFVDASFTELRVEWLPESPSIQSISLSAPGYEGEFPARVGRQRVQLEPLVELPKRCWDVRRIAPDAYQCDQTVFANGAAIADFDKAALVIGWEGFVAVWKGTLLRILRYQGGQLTEVASMDVANGVPYSMEWHEQAGFLYLAGARTRTLAVSFDGEHLGQSPRDLGPSGALAISGEYLMQTRQAAEGQGLDICVFDPRKGFADPSCGTFAVFYGGFDRGVWFKNGYEVGLILPVEGKPEIVATWRSAERPGINGFIETMNHDTRFTSSVRGRPAELATRASCAFYEFDGSAELTLDVYPENEIHFGDPSLNAVSRANGNGRAGLRWCSDEGWTKTFVYASDRAD